MKRFAVSLILAGTCLAGGLLSGCRAYVDAEPDPAPASVNVEVDADKKPAP